MYVCVREIKRALRPLCLFRVRSKKCLTLRPGTFFNKIKWKLGLAVTELLPHQSLYQKSFQRSLSSTL